MTTGLLKSLETSKVGLWLHGCIHSLPRHRLEEACACWELWILEQHSEAHSRQAGHQNQSVRAEDNHQGGNDCPRDRCPKAKVFRQESLRDTLLLTRHQHAGELPDQDLLRPLPRAFSGSSTAGGRPRKEAEMRYKRRN